MNAHQQLSLLDPHDTFTGHLAGKSAIGEPRPGPKNQPRRARIPIERHPKGTVKNTLRRIGAGKGALAHLQMQIVDTQWHLRELQRQITAGREKFICIYVQKPIDTTTLMGIVGIDDLPPFLPPRAHRPIDPGPIGCVTQGYIDGRDYRQQLQRTGRRFIQI